MKHRDSLVTPALSARYFHYVLIGSPLFGWQALSHMMEPPLKRVLMTDGVIPKGQEGAKLGQTQLSFSSICRPKGCNVQLSIHLLPHSSIPQPVIHLNATIYYRKLRDIPLLRSSRDWNGMSQMTDVQLKKRKTSGWQDHIHKSYATPSKL